MKQVRGEIPNLVNGVSQQAPSLRLTSQSEIDDNTYPLIVDGLVKRPPTRHLTRNGISLDEDSFCHLILRDSVEQYSLVIEDDGTINVYDFAGNAATVTDNSNGYLSGLASAKEELSALTIADHTFILNKNKEILAGTATAPTRDAEGIVWVRQGNYGHDYKVNVDGVEEATYQTPDGGAASHSTNIRTNNIAEEMRTDLLAGGFGASPWTLNRYQSTVYLSNDTNDFDLAAEDSLGDTSMIALKDKVTNLGDLPPHNKEGFKIEVSGSDSEDADDYWVEFTWTSGTGSRGEYRESVAPGAKLGLNADTMPHVLERQSDGSFTFGPASWGERTTGDETSVPDPSFVGGTIKDIIFHRNRLGFITESNTVLSQSGDFYQFFRSTLTALLDTDPIDIAVSHTKVSLLHHAVPYQDELILFSEQTQFRLAGNDLLTPASVSARPLTEVDVDPNIAPIAVGSNTFFLEQGDFFAQLHEFFFDTSTETSDTETVSGHAPNYIPAGVTNIKGAHSLSLIAISTDGDPDTLYLYKYHTIDREKLQSAWVRWTIPGVSRICAYEFYKKSLYLIVRRGTDFYTEKINCEEGQAEAIHLDRRVALTSGTYDSLSDTTTWGTPYTMNSDIVAVTAEGDLPLGVQLTLDPPGTLTVRGDLSSQPIFIGCEYESKHRFSPFYYRDTRRRSQVAITDGRLQVFGLSIQFSNTSFFRVEVTPEGRATRSYTYSGLITGDPDSVTDKLVANDGHFAVPIYSRNDRVTVDIVNNTWRPMAINSAAWRGLFNPNSREL